MRSFVHESLLPHDPTRTHPAHADPYRLRRRFRAPTTSSTTALFHFDPARVPLADSDRNALISAVGKRGDEAIRELQRFFHTRKDAYAAAAHCVVGVAAGVSEQYARRIGSVAQHESGGRRVANQLEIERCAHHPHNGTPYIPGSSIKGAIRTAWLDQLNDGRSKLPDERSAQDIEKRLLNSRAGFHADPFRLVRIGDAAGPELQSRVVFSTNHKKRLVHDRDGRVVLARGPSTRREVIEPGQFRALSTELSLHALPGVRANDRVPGEAERISDFSTLALACNRYYLKRLDALLELLDARRFAAPDWIEHTRKLFSHLRPRLQAGELMLLRVGRHSGAESVTLDGIRSIRIMTGRNQRVVPRAPRCRRRRTGGRPLRHAAFGCGRLMTPTIRRRGLVLVLRPRHDSARRRPRHDQSRGAPHRLERRR